MLIAARKQLVPQGDVKIIINGVGDKYTGVSGKAGKKKYAGSFPVLSDITHGVAFVESKENIQKRFFIHLINFGL